MPYIRDRFGHRIRVPEWPSTEGMAILRRHYKKHHPRAFKKMIAKGVATRKERYGSAAPSRDNPSGHVHLDPALGPRLHEWHSGMMDPIYRVGSVAHAGRPVTIEEAVEAWEALDTLYDRADDPDLRDDLAGLMDELQMAILAEDAEAFDEDDD